MYQIMQVALRSGHGDDWSKVEDAATRKRIQNRLAQRAHRKKYGRKPAKKGVSQTKPHDPPGGGNATPQFSSSPEVTSSSSGIGEIASLRASATHLSVDLDQLDLSFVESLDQQPEFLQDDTVLGTLLSYDISSTPNIHSDNHSLVEETVPASHRQMISGDSTSTSPHYQLSPLIDNLLVIRALSTLSALLMNASVLQIACDRIRGRDIYIPSSLVPPTALTPTPLQTTIPHYPYVDLIPFPSWRDRMLQSQYVIDGVEIWGDITRDIKVWGNTPWEDRGWEISERFAVKWWFLLDDEILRATNFWRGAREEEGLSMSGIRGRLKGGLMLGN